MPQYLYQLDSGVLVIRDGTLDVPSAFGNAVTAWALSDPVTLEAAGTLSALTLNTSTVPENATPGTVVGTLQSVTAGSELTLTNTAGDRFALSGSDVVAGATGLDYSAATSHGIEVTETHPNTTNSPRVTPLTISVTEVIGGTSITQNNATFTVSAARPTGTYADGSPWVVADAGETFTTLPAATTVNGTDGNSQAYTGRNVHGLMKNPGSGGISGNGPQGWDSLNPGIGALSPYQAGLDIDPGSNGGTPVALTEGTYVKFVSALTGLPTNNRPVGTDMVPLTVVAAEPAADAIRPPVSSTSKVSVIAASDINTGAFQNLAAPASTPSYATVLDWVDAYVEATQPDFLNNTGLKGANNHPEYGRDVANNLHRALLWLNTDAGTETQKRTITACLCAIAGDFVEAAVQGAVTPGIGGGSSFKKALIAVCAAALGANAPASWLTYLSAANNSRWAEDSQIFTVGINEVLVARSTARTLTPYEYYMVGATEWREQSTNNGNLAGSNWDALYRDIVAFSLLPGSLAVELTTGARALWDNDAFWRYQDTVFEHIDVASAGGNGALTFTREMMAAHRVAEVTAPTIQSAQFTGDTVWFTCNQALAELATAPAGGSFTVNVNGSPVTVNTVNLFRNNVGLTLASSTSEGDTVTIAYTPGANAITNVDGTQLAAFTGQAATFFNPLGDIGPSIHDTSDFSTPLGTGASIIDLDSFRSIRNVSGQGRVTLAGLTIGSKIRIRGILSKFDTPTALNFRVMDPNGTTVLFTTDSAGVFDTGEITLTTTSIQFYANANDKGFQVDNFHTSDPDAVPLAPAGPAPTTALTSAPTAYPPTINIGFPGGVEAAGDTVTLKLFTGQTLTDLQSWPDFSAPTSTQDFTLTTNLADLATAVNAALSGIGSGIGSVYLTHTPAGGTESLPSLAVVYGTALTPALISTTPTNELSDVAMATDRIFNQPVELAIIGADGARIDMVPIKPDGNPAGPAELEAYARSPIWRRTVKNDGVINFSPAQDANGDNIFNIAYDVTSSGNGVLVLDLTDNITLIETDITPTAAGFTDQTNAAFQTSYNSGDWTLAGMAPFTFQEGAFTATNGATYTKNGTAGLTASPFTYANGDVFSIQAQATDNGLTSRGTLIMGGTTETFGAVPDIEVTPAVNFAAENDAATSTSFSSNTVTLAGIGAGYTLPATIALPAGWTYTKNATAGLTASSFTYQADDTLSVQGTSSADPASGLSATATLADGTELTYAIATAAPADPPLQQALLTRLDPYDLASMSTARNDTGAVTANGQTIGTMDNKAPIGDTLIAESDTRIPQITGIGALPRFDFTNDRANLRQTKTGALGIADGIKAGAFSMIFSFTTSVTSNRYIMSEGRNGGSSDLSLVRLRASSNYTLGLHLFDAAGTQTSIALSTFQDALDGKISFSDGPSTYCIDYDGTTWRLWNNKALVRETVAAVPAGFFNDGAPTRPDVGSIGLSLLAGSGSANSIEQMASTEELYGLTIYNQSLASNEAERNAEIEWAAFAYTGENI